MSTGPPSVSRSRRHRWDGSPSQSGIRVLNRAEINTLFAKWRHAPRQRQASSREEHIVAANEDQPRASKIRNGESEDPTQGREVGAEPYEDPTQGREVGAEPNEDPTQGREVGAEPNEDPTQGR
jgi:hypothetical protein